ncbi:MAG: signal peptidase II, partial [Dysgonamonadaceae bacterium]
VVDMLYFPIIETTLPNWVPFWGGTEILFFRFIFNLADASISVGVVLLLLFYRKTLSHSLQSDAERQKTILKNQETK